MSHDGERALGLDVGTKFIGVAITDGAGVAAHALSTLPRTGNQSDAKAVTALAVEHGASHIVVGMPYELSGRVGPRARRVQVFIGVLEAVAADHRVESWDERFSTSAVLRDMRAGDMSRKKQKAVVDQQAAQYILQGWLDSRRQS